MEEKTYNKNLTSISEDSTIKFPNTIMAQTLENRKPIFLNEEILEKTKIINKKFGKFFLKIKPESLEVLEKNFLQYFFNPTSPLLDQYPALKKIFSEKKRLSLKHKINAGQLYFYSLKTNQTKKERIETNGKMRVFNHSQNFTTNPSKDFYEYELYKYKKNQSKKNLPFYKPNNKDIHSFEKKTDSISEYINSNLKKTKYKKNSRLNLSRNKRYFNSFIKNKTNDNNKNNSERIKMNNKEKNKTQELFGILKSKIPLFSGFIKINNNNKNNKSNDSNNSYFGKINKNFKINQKLNMKKSLINNSISYNSKNSNYFNKNNSLLSKPNNILKSNNNKKNLINSVNNNSNSTYPQKEYNTDRGENSFRTSNRISPIIKKNHHLNLSIQLKKMLIKKNNLDYKIDGLNSYINKFNDKLIKLIDVNKTSVSKKLSLKEKKDENYVDLRKLLLNNKKIIRTQFGKKFEIEDILNEAKNIDNSEAEKREKRNFEKNLSRMPDDMALYMVDRFYKTELDLSRQRDQERMIELNIKKKKEEKENNIKKLREKTNQNHHKIIYLKNKIFFQN